MFPTKDFRTEWRPVFHRGRPDGTAQLLVIGQDPARHEVIARRTLVRGAGHRIQGFLAKLGLTRSYVMLNTYVYSVFGQGGGNKHNNNPTIADSAFVPDLPCCDFGVAGETREVYHANLSGRI